jgi:hypothetical protein
MSLANASFSETWFDDTVAARSSSSTSVVPFDLFFQGSTTSVPSLRVIAHVSRCGSTLMANLLALRSKTMVLKEPAFIAELAQAVALAPSGVEQRRYAALLARLLAYVAHTAAAAERTPVVKLTSWTVPIVLACLDEVAIHSQWLLQWREPDKVVSSNLAVPPSWGKPSHRCRAARRVVGMDTFELDDLELYALVWTHVVSAFARSSDVTQFRTLGYGEFCEDKARGLRAVETWFGIDGPGLPPGYAAESNRYSKGRPTDAFDPAGIHVRPDLDPAAAQRLDALTGAARAWLMDCAERRLL